MSALTYTATKGLKHIGTEVGSWLADTTAEVVTGAEIITNGVFATDSDWTKGTGWTIGSGVASSSSTGNLSQNVTLVTGEKYTVAFQILNYSSGDVAVDVSSNTSGDFGADGYFAFSFTAVGASTTIYFIPQGGAFVADIDNVSLRLSDEDLSTTAHDLAYYGSITKSAVATGSTVMAYSGFSASDYLRHQSYEAATDLSDEVTCIAWHRSTALSDEEIVTNFQTSGDPGGYSLWRSSAGFARFTTRSDVPANHFITGTTYLPGGIPTWHLIIATLDTAGNMNIYVDGVIDAATVTGAAVGGTANTAVTVGTGTTGSSPCNDAIALVRVLSTALTATQIKTIYDAEKHMFKANSVFTQVGESYSLDVDMPVVNRSEKSISNKTISLGGNQETVFQRSDVMHNITIGPTHKNGMPELRTFLQSVNAGETFTFDPYGTVASPDDPISVVTDGGHNESRQNGTNYFNISMKLREV